MGNRHTKSEGTRMKTVRSTIRKSLILTVALLSALLVATNGATHNSALAKQTIPGALTASTGQAKQARPGSPQVPVGSGFSYQGQLKVGGNPSNGQYDLTFALYDALSGGTQVGSTITMLNQTVTTGLFTVTLDFG